MCLTVSFRVLYEEPANGKQDVVAKKKCGRQRKHLKTIHNSTDVVLLFERQSVLFWFFALNRWPLTSFCNIPWMAVIG